VDHPGAHPAAEATATVADEEEEDSGEELVRPFPDISRLSHPTARVSEQLRALIRIYATYTSSEKLRKDDAADLSTPRRRFISNSLRVFNILTCSEDVPLTLSFFLVSRWSRWTWRRTRWIRRWIQRRTSR
jgi:hypothetical protein